MMRARIVMAAVAVLVLAAGAIAQRRAFDLADAIARTLGDGRNQRGLETTIADGKKLVEIRAAITVEAIKKALAAK